MSKKCRYCNNDFQKDTEHVFPSGLGGQDLYIDCVCEECNNEFSKLEGELYQKSPIAFMRSVEGVKLPKNKPAFFKANVLLHFDNVTGLIYEMGQFNEMQLFIRPQIVRLNNKFYIEGNTNEDDNVFVKKFKLWRDNSLRVIIRKPKTKDDWVGFAQLKISDGQFTHQILEERIKTKNEIVIELLSNSHELFDRLSPRLYIDDNENLKLRAKSIDEAVNFITDFLNFTMLNIPLKSVGEERTIINPVISVGLNFDPLKLEQALVKIGLNCLMHYIPSVRDKSSLDNIISFVRTGNPKMLAGVVKKSQLIDTPINSHNILFAQLETSLNVRLSLFNGHFIYNFYIPDLQALKPKEYNRLVIEYKQRVNKFENTIEFLKSFDSKF
jgi:hypothetical protein